MSTDDDKLLAKINAAVAAANNAENNMTTAQAELVSRSKEVGVLLLEAKKLHPAVKDFETFLQKVHGLKLSRAYDLLRLAGGRTTDEELRKENRDRVKKHRDKKKLQARSRSGAGAAEAFRRIAGIRRGQRGEAQSRERSRRGRARAFRYIEHCNGIRGGESRQGVGSLLCGIRRRLSHVSPEDHGRGRSAEGAPACF